MTDEYIKKMDITQRVLAITGEWKDGPEFWIPIDPVLGNIALLPAEDVAPVRHGKWVKTGAYPHRVYCSVCYRTYAQAHWEVWKDGSLARAYCPNCGARMDGDEDE